MSRPGIHISIPTPCHESWDSMDVTERGAFCHSCQKEVIDFSAMTDREVIEYLEKHKTGCGRFRQDQLDTNLTVPKLDNGIFRWRALFLGLLPFIGAKSLFSSPYHDRTGAEQNSVYNSQKSDTSMLSRDRFPIDTDITISGKVIDENGEGMVAASIILLDSNINSHKIGTLTDVDGNFSLILHKDSLRNNVSHNLKVSNIGYEPKIIGISNLSKQSYTIRLELKNKYLLDQVIVAGGISFHRPTPAQKIKYWFRRTFRIRKHR